MTPKLAQSVDPIFLHVLDLLDRIGDGQEPNASEEQIRIIALLDQAEAMMGKSQQWELAKYALVSWTDEMLVDAEWQGRDWWSNNVLEVELFKTRLCNERFYVKAQEASHLEGRDALEVFYVCAVLGFRGLYRDANLAAMFTEAHGLPADLQTWAKQISMSIRLGQGRPALARSGLEMHGAPPLFTRERVVWPWVAAVSLAAINALLFWF
ncbi:MAG: DotU family type IV/VI secretion system protein [Planctomycetales bacterium]|nr:DotU family type IV/VI secretion system protein [Planctomycetales bacterium]